MTLEGRGRPCGGLVYRRQHAGHQIGHAGHARVGRRVAEAGPADMDLLRRVGKTLGGRAPELSVAGGAGEEEEFGGEWGHGSVLEGSEAGCVGQGCAVVYHTRWLWLLLPPVGRHFYSELLRKLGVNPCRLHLG